MKLEHTELGAQQAQAGHEQSLVRQRHLGSCKTDNRIEREKERRRGQNDSPPACLSSRSASSSMRSESSSLMATTASMSVKPARANPP